MTRAERRHLRQKFIKRAYKMAETWGYTMSHSFICRFAKNRRLCSCWACKRGKPLDRSPIE